MYLALGFALGLALGLTGAGGAIVAVPLLIFALHLPAQEAMGISLGAVSAAAMVGVWLRRRQQPPLWRAAAGLAVTGMVFAPVGRWLSYRFDEQWLVLLFCALALVLAVRMWRSALRPVVDAGADQALSLNMPVFLLAGCGLGLLSGLFGVGGGFLIVPFLTLYGGLSIERAISTSLLVIGLVGITGYAYHIFTTRMDDVSLLSYIALGSMLGIFVGNAIGARLPAQRLQQVFSIFVILVTLQLLYRTFAT